MTHQRGLLRGLVGALVILAPLWLAALACNFQGQQDTEAMRQTDIALGIQQTLLAQTQSALVVESNKPTPAVVYVTATRVAPTPGAEAVVNRPTDTPQPAPTLPASASPPPESTPAAQAIPIQDWKLYVFVKLTNDCKVSGGPCWMVNQSGSKAKTSGIPEGTLTSVEVYPIDPAWPNPYLVFAHRREELRDFSANVQIQSTGGLWRTVKVYEEASNSWVTEAISLSLFKGETISVRFSSALTGGVALRPSPKGISWYVQDVMIVPDYRP